MSKIIIDSKEFEVEDGITIMQACDSLGIRIPRFCYHDKLSIAGNCRMCLVEVAGSARMVSSCSMPINNGMVINTDNEKVRKAREGVMEFLLINHPLDCPVCDRGGECDLQDQAMIYGKYYSRYKEKRRTVKSKEFGPFIRTVMTRCIHCMRCERFMDEIAGENVVVAVGRGEKKEIICTAKNGIRSELSGNLVEVCPVGALTSKQFNAHGRGWQFKSVPAIDVSDAVGTNVTVQTFGMEIMRIQPRLNEDINEIWLADKGRFIVDGLKNNRIDKSWVKDDDNYYKSLELDEALGVFSDKIKSLSPNNIAVIAGDFTDVDTLFDVKKLSKVMGEWYLESRQNGAYVDLDKPVSWRFNSTFMGIERADAILMVGVNPKKEAPVLNARIRKRYLKGAFLRGEDFTISVIGDKQDLSYKYDYIGDDVTILKDILNDKHRFSGILRNSSAPMIIVGQGAMQRSDASAILHLLSDISDKYGVVKDGWNGFNNLQLNASVVGALELGFVNQNNIQGIYEGVNKGEIKLVYCINADELDFSKLKGAYIVYQGSNADNGAKNADLIIPSANYLEKTSIWVNNEGRAQLSMQAVKPIAGVKADSEIISSLANKLGVNLNELTPKRLEEINTIFAEIGVIKKTQWQKLGKEGDLSKQKLVNSIDDYYLTNSIARSSDFMKNASLLFNENDKCEQEEFLNNE